ncbi:hypothetical protein QBC39DRAFT_433345 [Podospora conica]|nr:hypothetical protein QBC39DRAFT_433345 [Schizothecium conicum]
MSHYPQPRPTTTAGIPPNNQTQDYRTTTTSYRPLTATSSYRPLTSPPSNHNTTTTTTTSYRPLLASYFPSNPAAQDDQNHEEILPPPVLRTLQTAQQASHSLDELVRLRDAKAGQLGNVALEGINAVIARSERNLMELARLVEEVEPPKGKRGGKSAWQRRVECPLFDTAPVVLVSTPPAVVAAPPADGSLPRRPVHKTRASLPAMGTARPGMSDGVPPWDGKRVRSSTTFEAAGMAAMFGSMMPPSPTQAAPQVQAAPHTQAAPHIQTAPLFQAAAPAAMFGTAKPPPQQKVYKPYRPSMAKNPSTTSTASTPQPSPLPSHASLSQSSTPAPNTPSPQQQPAHLYQQTSPPFTIPRKPHASVDYTNVKPLSTIPQDLIHRYDLYDAPMPSPPLPPPSPPAPPAPAPADPTASGPGYTPSNSTTGMIASLDAPPTRPGLRAFPFLGNVNKLTKRPVSKETRPATAVPPLSESPMVFPVRVETRGDAEVFGKSRGRSSSWYTLPQASSVESFGTYGLKGGDKYGDGEKEVLGGGGGGGGVHELDAEVSLSSLDGPPRTGHTGPRLSSAIRWLSSLDGPPRTGYTSTGHTGPRLYSAILWLSSLLDLDPHGPH